MSVASCSTASYLLEGPSSLAFTGDGYGPKLLLGVTEPPSSDFKALSRAHHTSRVRLVGNSFEISTSLPRPKRNSLVFEIPPADEGSALPFC